MRARTAMPDRAAQGPGRRLAEVASEPAVHRAFAWLHLHELQLRRWQLELLAIPAPPFHEDARAVWFCRQFRALGLREPQIDAEGNVVAFLGPSPSGREALLLSAHLDTVFPPGTATIPREDGARLLCPGACDNGAGLTALLALAAACQHAGLEPAAPVIFAANVGEEGPGDLRGMRHLFAAPPFGAKLSTAIALEGAGHRLAVDRALGSRRLEATLTGPGGHSWADAQRPNPILVLSAALLAMAELPLPTQPRTTLNVGTMEGGTSVNSIPERATAQLDLRSSAEEELYRLEEAVRAVLRTEVERRNRGVAEGDRLQLTVERIGMRPVGRLLPEAKLRDSLRAVDRHLGIETDLRLGSTDANVPLSLGVEALAIGAGGQGGALHSTAEWYDPTNRELALRRVLLLVLDSCATLAARHPQSRSAAG